MKRDLSVRRRGGPEQPAVRYVLEAFDEVVGASLFLAHDENVRSRSGSGPKRDALSSALVMRYTEIAREAHVPDGQMWALVTGLYHGMMIYRKALELQAFEGSMTDPQGHAILNRSEEVEEVVAR